MSKSKKKIIQEPPALPPLSHSNSNSQHNTAPATPTTPATTLPPLWHSLESKVRHEKTSELAGAILAVDAQYFLRRLEPVMAPLFTFQTSSRVNEPMCTFTSSPAATLHSVLHEEIRRLSEIDRLRVLFVFEGLGDASDAQLPTHEKTPRAQSQMIRKGRDEAWRKVANGIVKKDQAWNSHVFDSLPGPRLQTEDTVSEFMTFLIQNREKYPRVDYIRAPYTAGAQMSYYYAEKIVSCVFGPPTLFWETESPVTNVILEIGKGTFHYLEKKDMSNVRKIPSSNGGDECHFPGDNIFKSETVLDAKGGLVPSQSAPQSAKNVDDAAFIQHALGFISTSVLAAATRGSMVELMPAVDSREVRTVLERIIPLRTQITCKLFQQHNSTSMLKWYRWFKDGPTEVARPPSIELDEWDLASSPPTSNCVTFSKAASRYHISAISASKVSVRVEPTPAAITTTVHLKFLDLLGYFTHSTVEDTNSNTVERSGKSVFSECLELCPDDSESAVTLIELIRTKSLTSKRTVEPDQDAPTTPMPFKDAEEVRSRAAIMVARLFSLVPVRMNPSVPFTQHVSKDMAAFWCILRTFRTLLRHLGEVLCSNVMREMATNDIELKTMLPFARAESFVLGAVLEYAICLGPNFNSDNSQMTPNERIAHLERAFPSILNLRESLERGFAWVEHAHSLAERLAQMDEEDNTSNRDHYQATLRAMKEALNVSEQVRQKLFGPAVGKNKP
eukprot:PhM_4_TR8293/c4_g1_i1/m.40641